MHPTVPSRPPLGSNDGNTSTLPFPSMSYTNTDPSQPARVGFVPQLWQQRRTRTLEILRQYSHMIDWVADFGCNACALARVLTNSCDFTRLTCVDLDPEVLRAVDVQPLARQPERGWNHAEEEVEQLLDDGEVDRWRERPMRIELMNGSIVDYDERVVGVDAIVLSEVIEHMDPEPLALLPRALFEFYRPKIVIVSTPNQTFNLHFPDPTRVRDPDHRFEWTEEQFTAWCDEQAARYGYSYTLSGVGLWPCCARGQHERRGYASQFATFVCNDLVGKVEDLAICKWPVKVPAGVTTRCDSGMDGQEGAAAALASRPWTCIKAYDFSGYPGSDLASVQVDGANGWSLTPAQDRVLRRVLDALLYHLCPAAVGIANSSSYSCTLSQAWSQPAVRQAFRVPANLIAFLQLPDLSSRVGIQWVLPKDTGSIAPHLLHQVVWGKADAGRIERSEQDVDAVLEVLICERLEEERKRQEEAGEQDEWGDSGDDLWDWEKGEEAIPAEVAHGSQGAGYEIEYGAGRTFWDQGPLWGQDHARGEWSSEGSGDWNEE